MQPQTTWQPILSGAPATSAWDAISAIARDLRQKPIDNASLAGGDAGLALFYAYLAEARPNEGYDEDAARHLEAAIDALANTPMLPGLYAGFTGIAFAAELLQGDPSVPEEEDPAHAIDEALLEHLDQPKWEDDYDLISGLVGYGVYALERMPRLSAARCLERILDHLEASARRVDGGVSWWTAPELLPEWQREVHPEGYYNLGLAHGVPGVMGLLGRMIGAGVAASRARALLEGMTSWLLALRMPKAGARFGSVCRPGLGPSPSRAAWCYGDPGVAAALLVAGRAVNDPAILGAARELTFECTARTAEESGVRDAGICHGAVGLAHLYLRWHQAGDARFLEPAREWFERRL